MIKAFQKLGPGLLFAGAAIGVSHLVQSTRAGADFGFGLLWALILIHIVKYPFFQFGTRYASITGKNLIEGYNQLGKGVVIAYFCINLTTMFTFQVAVTIVTAGLASQLFGVSNNPVLWSVILTLFCFLLLVIGRYQLLDKLIKIIIVLLTISTFLTVVVAAFNTGNVFSFQQIIPKESAGIGFLIAFLGWMPAPLDVSIWQSLWTVEKQQGKTNFKQAIFDFNIGFIGTLIVGICFLTLGALVMFYSNERFSSNAIVFSNQLIELYTKNLGTHFSIFIAIAAFTTMFSTTITTLDASPRAMQTTIKVLTKNQKNTFLHSYWWWISFLAAGTISILLFFMSEMGFLVKLATTLSFLTAPFFAIVNYLLMTKGLSKKHQISTFMKVYSLLGILFLIGFSFWYLTSFIF